MRRKRRGEEDGEERRNIRRKAKKRREAEEGTSSKCLSIKGGERTRWRGPGCQEEESHVGGDQPPAPVGREIGLPV